MRETEFNDSSDVFVEQAEYIEIGAFEEWTEDHPFEGQILQKLCRGGGKLISGPRGCGKTTLLLKAYRKLLGPSERGLPVYVNFKSSLRLEPLYREQANAMFWFNQWMLLKCYIGLLETLELLHVKPPRELTMTKASAARAAENLELNSGDTIENKQAELTVEGLVNGIDCALAATGRIRCLLFFDDAAHAFSPEQQRDFFDFFRRVKRNNISPKAAIYPGVTVLSPSFHIGHDAEEIDVWLDPYSSNYLPFMRSLLERRLPKTVFSDLEKADGLLDLVCFGAFGVPRALLNIVREFYEEDESSGSSKFTVKFTSRAALAAIRSSYEHTLGVHASLQKKLPMYQNFFTAGEDVMSSMILAVKAYNKEKSEKRQSVSGAIATPMDAGIERVIGFLEYAGLVRARKTVSRGEKGVFRIIQLHAGGLIARNALLGRKSVRADLFSKALQERHAHEFTRVTPSKLLKTNRLQDRLELSLPPCPHCSASRASESAKFCLNCGSPLAALSTFRQLVQQDISELPISVVRVNRIKEYSTICTIGDILMDHDNKKLRGVPRIGPYWAKRISHYAEEYIA